MRQLSRLLKRAYYRLNHTSCICITYSFSVHLFRQLWAVFYVSFYIRVKSLLHILKGQPRQESIWDIIISLPRCGVFCYRNVCCCLCFLLTLPEWWKLKSYRDYRGRSLVRWKTPTTSIIYMYNVTPTSGTSPNTTKWEFLTTVTLMNYDEVQ